MTEYETQSLLMARDAFFIYLAADIIALLALVAAVVGGFAAYRSAKAVIEQLRVARWNSLLSFEQDMAARRTRLAEIGMQLNTELATTMLRAMYEEAKESYFNSLDRLASSILNGHFPDQEMRQDYQEVVSNVVRQFPQDFDTGTRYRKIVKLYNRWQDQV